MIHIKGIMRRTLAVLTLLGALAAAGFEASAATEEQMSMGRATAAAFYIRQAHPKEAGKLVGKKFSSMQQLKDAVAGDKVLEEAYQKVRSKGMPDQAKYGSWGKEEYLDYWSSKFFANAGLPNSSMQSSQIRSALSGVNVTGVSSEDAEAEAIAENAAEEPETASQQQEVVQDYPQQVFSGPYSDSAKVTDSTATESVKETESSGSSTWIYVVILVVLIIIVVWLVVFALKNMRNGDGGNNGGNGNNGGARMAPPAGDSVIIGAQPQQPRQQPLYTRQQPAVDPSVERIRRDLEESRRAEMDARAQADALTRRLASLEDEVRSLRDRQPTPYAGRQQDPYAQRQQETFGERPAPRTLNDSYSRESMEPVQPLRAPGVPNERPSRPGATAPRMAAGADTRVIYLGRANRQGIFVRADKRFVEGKTIYRLETSDGLTGTFTVDPSPQVSAMAVIDPETAFCAASEIRGGVGDSFTRILTESPGTAIFEGGCWRVIRTAVIRLD